jgi:hypothetical protein
MEAKHIAQADSSNMGRNVESSVCTLETTCFIVTFLADVDGI